MTDYALPITGTGSAQTVSAEDHDAEVNRRIDEAVDAEKNRALAAESALDVRVDALEAPGNVDTADLAGNAVTNAKMATMAAATIKGRAAGAGVGDPQDLTASQARTAMGLGTAATTDASAYATAAQGTLADTAVQPGDDVSALVETPVAKIMTAAERTKLAGIADAATANASDAALRDRATHTGTQAISTVTGLQTALDGKATTAQGAKADTAVQPGNDVSVLAETATAKIMTGAERTKLAGIAAGATANATDADLRNRATHTGAQAISTVTGLQAALDAQTDALTTKADAAAVDDAATGTRVPLIVAQDDVVLYLDPAGALNGRPLGDPMRRSVLDGVVDLVDATGPAPVALVDGQAAVWLDAKGNLGARGMASTLRRAAVSDIVTDLPPEGDKVPLLLAGDRVLLWIGPDGLSGPGIIKGISEADARAAFAPRASAGDLPASTDGRSLTRARRKAAQVRAGASETLRVAMIGDSWTQGVAIPNAMHALLAGIMGDCGKSWVHAATSGHWSGVTVTASGGWTWLDANETTGWPYGAAPDGQMGWTSTATDTLTIVTPSCTEARIYTRRHGGTWRWRLDGGSWTTVTEATGGALTITTIGGLSAASHTIEIDTTGNAGVVAWCGMDTRTAGAKAEVVKIGNGGLRGIDMQTYIAGAQDILADLAPDVVICILGTNDYIYVDSTVPSFGTALATLTTTARAAAPGVGLVFVAPALSPTTPVTPLIEYRDEAYARALALGAEYLGAYDLIAPYASDAALWNDSRHLNQTGGDVLSRLINNRLMGI